MQPAEYKFQTPAHRFNWVVLPTQLGKLSRKLLASSTDGYFIAATGAGSFLTPLLFAAGLTWGWLQFDYFYVYTESLWFLVLAILLGSFSSHLGLVFTIGFILGDFFLADTHYIKYQGATRTLALVISYIVLLLVTIVPAIVIKNLVVEIKLPATVDLTTKLIAGAILYAALTYFYLYFWANMAPVLIRPVFTWHDGQPTVPAITILQNKTDWLVWPGVGMAILRLVLQTRMALNPANQPFYKTMESHFFNVSLNRPVTSYINPWIRTFLFACITAFTLSGILLDWTSTIIVGALAFLFQALSAGLIPRPAFINKWSERIYKIPAVFRVVAAFIVIFFITKYIVSAMWQSGRNFLPLIIATCFAFLILFLLNPGKPSNPLSYEPKE